MTVRFNRVLFRYAGQTAAFALAAAAALRYYGNEEIRTLGTLLRVQRFI
jgi:hypothetical protein